MDDAQRMNSSDAGPESSFAVDGLNQGKVLLVGESMGLFAADMEGPCSRVNEFNASVAGAEVNVALGLLRMGQQPVYVTRVGDDPIGERIRIFLEENGLTDSRVTVDETRRTGFMMKTKVCKGDPATYYFRKNSAAAAISPQDVFDIDLTGISLLHLTGILPPLSRSALDASDALVARARFNNLFISFDPNLRPALWETPHLMHATLKRLASQADLVMPGRSEGEELFGVSTVEDVGKAFIDNGAKYVVVKDGARGAWATDGDNGVYIPGFVVDHVVDSVGAGDGFAAGLLSGLLEGLPIEAAAERGCAIGAIQTQFISDNEGLPDKSRLAQFMSTHERAKRRLAQTV
ncbi:sugar kinase [Bifidobacterium sp. ESL0704]|uniref:sugar kinase n=1 Tax=Bifidobacterium sp. ESL0704 TaxID=2983219 RepID=UPI0023F64030|nr:sugar kinase [Bifidobacterium sp. ESL0704]WEV53273.1 sugar kinase [Bifidobacterium sp. ESL0704]